MPRHWYGGALSVLTGTCQWIKALFGQYIFKLNYEALKPLPINLSLCWRSSFSFLDLPMSPGPILYYQSRLFTYRDYMYVKPHMLTRLEYSSFSNNFQHNPVGRWDMVHCETSMTSPFPLRSLPIPSRSYQCPLVYSPAPLWTSGIVIPKMDWWNNTLTYLLSSSAWDPHQQSRLDPWWRNIVLGCVSSFLWSISSHLFLVTWCSYYPGTLCFCQRHIPVPRWNIWSTASVVVRHPPQLYWPQWSSSCSYFASLTYWVTNRVPWAWFPQCVSTCHHVPSMMRTPTTSRRSGCPHSVSGEIVWYTSHISVGDTVSSYFPRWVLSPVL